MPTTDDATATQPPRIPTGQELYDQIMAHVEPELTTEGLKTLEDKYKGETPEQFTERKQRYAQAFDRYDQAYSGYLATLQSQVNRFRQASVDQVEMEDRANENDMLQSLSKNFL